MRLAGIPVYVKRWTCIAYIVRLEFFFLRNNRTYPDYLYYSTLYTQSDITVPVTRFTQTARRKIFANRNLILGYIHTKHTDIYIWQGDRIILIYV